MRQTVDLGGNGAINYKFGTDGFLAQKGGISFGENCEDHITFQVMLHEEGRIIHVYDSIHRFFYQYALKNHLGNTRVLFQDINRNDTIDVWCDTIAELIQINHYYPFVMPARP